MPEHIPDDLVTLQRHVLDAQRDLFAYDGEDRDEHHRLRAAESAAVLALYRHPARAGVNWRDLLEAARAVDQPA